MKGAAHGFRNLSVIKIPDAFEHRMKGLKTKNDNFMNKQKNKPRRLLPALLRCMELALGTHLSEALAAENGTVGLGLEGHLGLTAATGASSSEELTGATGAVLASVTASLAALGLVLEATLCVEFLLTSSENEFVAALFAN